MPRASRGLVTAGERWAPAALPGQAVAVLPWAPPRALYVRDPAKPPAEDRQDPTCSHLRNEQKRSRGSPGILPPRVHFWWETGFFAPLVSKAVLGLCQFLTKHRACGLQVGASAPGAFSQPLPFLGHRSGFPLIPSLHPPSSSPLSSIALLSHSFWLVGERDSQSGVAPAPPGCVLHLCAVQRGSGQQPLTRTRRNLETFPHSSTRSISKKSM